MSPETPRSVSDKLAPWLLFGFFFPFYLAGHQANPPYDGAAFTVWWRHGVDWLHPHHPLFAYLLAWTIAAGRALGLPALGAGLVHVAFFSALSLALFYTFLRRCGAGAIVSACFAIMLGTNSTVLENATTVELYAASLFAIMLSLHAYLSVARQAGALNVLGLWLLCLIVLSLHAGYAMWVLSVYLALAWRDRGNAGKGILWLAQGGAAGAVFIIWLFAADMLSPEAFVDTKVFYEKFWMRAEDGGILWRCVRAPLYDFSAFAGLILFPALAGLAAFRRAHADMARFFVISTISFFSFYTFWVPDHGAFYLPLQPVWGLFAALAVERMARGADKARLALFLAGMALYAVLFVWAPFGRSYKINWPGQAVTWALGIAFVPVLALSWLGGGYLRNLGGSTGSRRAPTMVCAGLAVLISLAIYLPGVFFLLKPNPDTLLLRSFREMDTPPGARLITSLPDFRPEAITERACLTAPNIFAAPPSPQEYEWFNLQFHLWVKESGDPETPLYFDETCYIYRDWLWAINREWGKKNGKETSFHEDFEFIPTEAGAFVFYRAAPAH